MQVVPPTQQDGGPQLFRAAGYICMVPTAKAFAPPRDLAPRNQKLFLGPGQEI
jgi:hypothetical protein